MNFSKYTNKTENDILSEFGTSFEGLAKKEVSLRQKKYGFNEIKTKKISAFSILKRQAQSPFFYLLFFASLISLAIGEFLDFGVILFVVFTNATIGFFQEYKAEKAVFLLKKFISQNVKVLRDNKEQCL